MSRTKFSSYEQLRYLTVIFFVHLLLFDQVHYLILCESCLSLKNFIRYIFQIVLIIQQESTNICVGYFGIVRAYKNMSAGEIEDSFVKRCLWIESCWSYFSTWQKWNLFQIIHAELATSIFCHPPVLFAWLTTISQQVDPWIYIGD